MPAKIGPIYNGPRDRRGLLIMLLGELVHRDEEMHERNLNLIKLARNAIISDTNPGRSQEVVDQLTEALQQYAPPFCYFGSHPDEDGRVGYWPDWPTILDLEPYFDANQAAHSRGWVRLVDPQSTDTLSIWKDGVCVLVLQPGEVGSGEA